MATKYIYWDKQHLAGYQKESNGIVVTLNPIASGIPQKWSNGFFEKLLDTKQIEKITIPEYEVKIKRLADAAKVLGEFAAKQQFIKEGL